MAPQKLENLLKADPLISQALIHGDREKYIVALLTLNEDTARKMGGRRSGVEFNGLKELSESQTSSRDAQQIGQRRQLRVGLKFRDYQEIRRSRPRFLGGGRRNDPELEAQKKSL